MQATQHTSFIKGNPDNGFVQTDFMMTTNPALQKGAKRGGTEKFTGADRAIMLSVQQEGVVQSLVPSLVL